MNPPKRDVLKSAWQAASARRRNIPLSLRARNPYVCPVTRATIGVLPGNERQKRYFRADEHPAETH
ncbi:hypothetical protein MESS4_270019 [Mesorhizobium sp. STM 4661]|nr:hypothetical protein MESS4_270019 [Mesorhizobium sp. STM 4661]